MQQLRNCLQQDFFTLDPVFAGWSVHEGRRLCLSRVLLLLNSAYPLDETAAVTASREVPAHRLTTLMTQAVRFQLATVMQRTALQPGDVQQGSTVDLLRDITEGDLGRARGPATQNDSSSSYRNGVRGRQEPSPPGRVARPIAPPQPRPVDSPQSKHTRDRLAVRGHRNRLSCLAVVKDTQPIRAVKFSSNGQRFAVGSNTSALRVYDTPVQNGAPIQASSKADPTPLRPELQFTQHHAGSIYSVAWSADDALIATGSNDKFVKVAPTDPQAIDWGDDRMTVGQHAGTVRAVLFREKSSQILSGSSDGRVLLWDCGEGQESQEHVQALDGHAAAVYALAMPKYDANIVVSGAADGTARVWDLRAERAVLTVSLAPSVRELEQYVMRMYSMHNSGHTHVRHVLFPTHAGCCDLFGHGQPGPRAICGFVRWSCAGLGYGDAGYSVGAANAHC